VLLYALRGEPDKAQQQLVGLEAVQGSDDTQSRAALDIGRAAAAMALGAPENALAAGEAATRTSMGMRVEGFRWGWPLAMEAALSADRADAAAELLRLVGDEAPGHVPPFLRAQLARYTALVHAGQNQHDTVEADLRRAITILTDLGYVYWLARARADLAGWLAAHGRSDEAAPLLTDAVDCLTRLGARPDLDRIRPAVGESVRT
jgi:tetratricopeptide (TPR) repeat protein